MSVNLLPAVFGLIGVVVGGLITAGPSYLLEAWKEKRTRIAAMALLIFSVAYAAHVFFPVKRISNISHLERRR
jgi:membrane protease YdiL (CAAX protease family)